MMRNHKEISDFIRDLYGAPEGLVPLHAPVFQGNEKKYVNECIDSTFVSSVGKFVDDFELAMAKFTGAKKAVACVNGTNALHLSLVLMGVEHGMEVLTQSLTFIATANAISYCGANPIFIDVDIDTMGMSPLALKNWLTENSVLNAQNQRINKATGKIIGACVPMHTFGLPCRIDELVEICEEFGIPLVEDAAESLGSYYKEQHTGTFGKIGVISFNGNKVITTGGGGILLFNDEELATRAKYLSTQAKVPHPWKFYHDHIGYNYRMPNINAAIGLAQLEQLPGFIASKREIAKRYEHFFKALKADSEGPVFVPEIGGAQSNYWLNAILFSNQEERDAFLDDSNASKIITRPAWELMHTLPMFKSASRGPLSNSENIAGRLVNIPSSPITQKQ